MLDKSVNYPDVPPIEMLILAEPVGYPLPYAP